MTSVLSRWQALVFDLDGTLYRTPTPLEKQIVPAIWAVAAEVLGVSIREAAVAVRKYNDQYDYCVHGFEKHHGVTAAEFIDRVYSRVDRSEIQPDPELRLALVKLAQEANLYVLTNSGQRHASAALERVGIADLFKEILSIEKTGFMLKPHRQAYEICADRVGCAPSEVIYFDDSVRNVQSAWRQGFQAVLISNGVAKAPLFYEMHIEVEHFPPPYAKAATHRLLEFLQQMPMILQSQSLNEAAMTDPVEEFFAHDLLRGVRYRLLVREGWTSDLADAATRGLIQFLLLLAERKSQHLVPPYLIDEAWHEALIDTRRYSSFCEAMCRCQVHHEPPIEAPINSEPSDVVFRREVTRTLDCARKRFSDLDDRIWNAKVAPWQVRLFPRSMAQP